MYSVYTINRSTVLSNGKISDLAPGPRHMSSVILNTYSNMYIIPYSTFTIHKTTVAVHIPTFSQIILTKI